MTWYIRIGTGSLPGVPAEVPAVPALGPRLVLVAELALAPEPAAIECVAPEAPPVAPDEELCELELEEPPE